MCKGVDMRK